MAFRALLFSKSPETSAALTNACTSAGISVEVCDDIFTAIRKGTQQAFSCVLADWSAQPEAGFLLKRARESGPTKSVVAIAIVDNDPTAAEIRDHRLDFLIYRPIAAEEAREVLAKASQKMQPAGPENVAETPEAGEQPRDATSIAAAADSSERDQDRHRQGDATGLIAPSEADGNNEAEIETGGEGQRARSYASTLHRACAAVLVLAAALFLWSARDVFVYLARTPESRVDVLRESVAALFSLNTSDTLPVPAARSDAQQDVSSSPTTGSSMEQTPQIGVVESEADLRGSRMELRKAADFPLPAPVYEHPDQGHAQAREQSPAIPESLRGSAPITRPVVVTVNPAQMMPVSAPAVMPSSTPSFSEPVSVSEEAERALLIRSVSPTYPPEALAQKLRGPVVLQATIGRDGSVQDLKILRGYFVLGKAAIAAVKQWRFQPYVLNGHAAQTQTVITVNFSDPPS